MSEVDELRAVSDRYMGAWLPKDIDTIAEIEAGRGFGHSVAFPRVARDTEQYKESLKSYFQMIDFISVDVINREIQVIGTTGLVWGHFSQTTKQKDGPVRTVYLRFTHTYSKVDGEWRLVLYHRSLIPSEHIP